MLFFGRRRQKIVLVVVLVLVLDPAARVMVYWSDGVLAYCAIVERFSHTLRPSKKM